MNMIVILTTILSTLESMPYVGPPVVFILHLVMPLSVVVSSFVILWQGLIGVCNALGAIPGLSFLQGIATKLKADDVLVEGVINNDIIPVLKALSMIPLPMASKPLIPKADK